MFFNGILTGLALGLAIIFLWRKLMREKRLERWREACNNESLLFIGKTSHADKILPAVPKWVQFGEYEPVEWLNCQLKELWPYINKAVKDTVFGIVEQQSKNLEGAVIAKIQATYADLGNNSPDIRGIKVSSWEKNQVVLDIDMTWQGDGKFKLEIITTTRLTVKPCLSNLSFTGNLRVILELTDKVPVIAAYVYALNRKPGGDHYKVTYDLSGAGLGAIPGLKGMIDGIIYSTVDDMMLWPKRQAAALIEGYDISHLQLQYSGEVLVTVVKANGLKNVDTLGKSDPRVAVYIDKKHEFVTYVVDNNLNPEWKDPIQVFRIPVDDALTATLYFRVEDKDTSITSSYDLMGYATLPMADLLKKEKETEYTLPFYNSLDSSERTTENLGTITIKAIYDSYESKEKRMAVTEAEKNWDPKVQSKSLAPDEARAAIAEAEQNAKDRAGKLEKMRGVGLAAKQLINLKKGNLVPVSKATVATKLTVPDIPEKEDGAAHASAGAATSAHSIASASPSISRSTGVTGGSLRLAAEAVKEFDAENSSGVDITIPASSTMSTSGLVETASSKTVDEEGKHGTRHKVSTFFKGIKGGLRTPKETSSSLEFPLESPGRDGLGKPPTPGAATPKKSGLFGGFKGKEKRSAEI